MASREEKMSAEIKVWFDNGQCEIFDSYHSGITEVPYRLYIYTNPEKTECLYIMLDKIESYQYKPGD